MTNTENTAFGEKTVYLGWDARGDGNVQTLDTTKVEIFYPKNATSHGAGEAGSPEWYPNWYHYWMQSAAGTGYEHVLYDDSGTGSEASGFARFVNGEWIARVGTGAADRTDQYDKVDGVAGIDALANFVRHENQHLIDYRAWWGVDKGRDATRDTDGDVIPDSLEPNMPAPGPYNVSIDPTYEDDDEYGPGWNDGEHHAKKTQPKWAEGAANKQDWASPGMQHKTNDKYDD